MTIISINNQSQWDEFIRQNQQGSFLQSFAWGEFVKKQGKKIWRLGVEDQGKLIAVILLHQTRVRLRQNTLEAARGPVVSDSIVKSRGQIQPVMQVITAAVDQIAAEEKSLLFQIDPLTTDSSWLEIFAELHFQKTYQSAQPHYTLILDLAEPLEKIFNSLHPKTRYNIRLAQKKQVKVFVDNSRVQDFYRLLNKTAVRQQVHFYRLDYFEKLLQLDFARLYLAEYQGQIIAANIMIFDAPAAVYLFGGADHDFRQVMAPHLLQWQAIVQAKEQGFKAYDFWGAVPERVKGHEQKWAGVTRFKQGFCPQTKITEYLGTFEKIYLPGRLKLYRGVKAVISKLSA